MEDEHRPLPPGWIRQFDPEEQHQFFVDTNADPPRSIWVHPYDDPDFLSTLPPSERSKHSRLHRSVTLDDITAEDTDDEHDGPSSHHHQSHQSHPRTTNQPPSSSSAPEPEPKGLQKYTRKLKDKLTATTHTERETSRSQRAEQERRAYETHLRARAAMLRALETGEPQFLGKDRQGRDVYVEPPPTRGPMGGYYTRGAGGGMGGYGYSPFARGNPYGGGYGGYGGSSIHGNQVFLRPGMPYGRRPAYGYGGRMEVETR